MTHRTGESETLLAAFELSRSIALRWLVVGSACIPISLFLFGGAYGLATGQYELAVAVGSETVGGPLLGFGLLVLACALVIVVHEAVHGLVMWRFGASPRFGVGVAHVVLPYAYATTDRALSRAEFLAVALAPLLLISAVGFPLAVALESPWLLVPLAVNAAGAVGDLWMAALVFRYPPHVRVVDDETGLSIYGRPDDRLPDPSTGGVVRAMVSAFALVVCLFLVGLLFAHPLVHLLGLESLSIGPVDTPWHVGTVSSEPDGVSTSVGVYAILAASTIAAVLAGFVRAIRN